MKKNRSKISKVQKILAILFLFSWSVVGLAHAYITTPPDLVVNPTLSEAVAINGSSSGTTTKTTEFEVFSKQNDNIHIARLYLFSREGCGFCKKEQQFLAQYLTTEPNVELIHYDIEKDKEAYLLLANLLEKRSNLSMGIPYTFVGGEIIAGFDSQETTGAQIIQAVERAKNGYDYNIKEYLELNQDANIQNTEIAVNLPFLGKTNLETFSLFSIATVLGLVDGFNPCALWVLVTFLLILMQIGNRRKMFYVAGLFIIAEAIMYYLILNVWYKTWDFIQLDAIITPLIGLLAIGSGLYFLYKYKKTRHKLVCDVTNLEQQISIQNKIHKLVNSPITLVSIIGIIGIALSVNIIEFACSIGIPQVFTKILEINILSFWEHQGYLLLYILAYMVDDIIIFGFALYGFDKLHHSEKYSKLSLLVGGILMLLFGVLMFVAPDILVF